VTSISSGTITFHGTKCLSPSYPYTPIPSKYLKKKKKKKNQNSKEKSLHPMVKTTVVVPWIITMMKTWQIGIMCRLIICVTYSWGYIVSSNLSFPILSFSISSYHPYPLYPHTYPIESIHPPFPYFDLDKDIGAKC